MNAERRKIVEEVLTALRGLSEKLGPVAEAEREAQENKPEQLQNLEAADYLDTAVNEIDAAIETLESAK